MPPDAIAFISMPFIIRRHFFIISMISCPAFFDYHAFAISPLHADTPLLRHYAISPYSHYAPLRRLRRFHAIAFAFTFAISLLPPLSRTLPLRARRFRRCFIKRRAEATTIIRH
jgi:hypothetical protein